MSGLYEAQRGCGFACAGGGDKHWAPAGGVGEGSAGELQQHQGGGQREPRRGGGGGGPFNLPGSAHFCAWKGWQGKGCMWEGVRASWRFGHAERGPAGCAAQQHAEALFAAACCHAPTSASHLTLRALKYNACDRANAAFRRGQHTVSKGQEPDAPFTSPMKQLNSPSFASPLTPNQRASD